MIAECVCAIVSVCLCVTVKF
uniref:Uncharacterized protein n=1 Tax=Anopheles arabiensis TaxID=7173 RepID=A0A182IGK7_ANOAR